ELEHAPSCRSVGRYIGPIYRPGRVSRPAPGLSSDAGPISVSAARYPLPPMSFRPEALRGSQPGAPGQIDYRLSRRHVLAELRRGRLGRPDVCDAHPELMRAAR